MSQPLQLKAYAKVNLGLDVLGTRPDGYHEVKMIMQTVKLFDRLTMEKNNSGEIILTTTLPYLPVNEKNLVYRAIALIKENYHISEGVTVHLEKHIPVAAGMAGGSTDAAAALIGMNQLFALNITQEKLMEYGLSLGADIPFCIIRGTALSEGIGEVLTPLPSIPNCWFLIIKPHFSMSTKLVYTELDSTADIEHPDIDGIVDAIKQKDFYGITSRLGNVLEPATGPYYKDILSIKRTLLDHGAHGALMSGSGSTVFGMFKSKEAANRALRAFTDNPDIKMAVVVRPFNKSLPTEAHRSRKKCEQDLIGTHRN